MVVVVVMMIDDYKCSMMTTTTVPMIVDKDCDDCEYRIAMSPKITGIASTKMQRKSRT